ncbi:hypothetical protein ACF08B_36560 [Streptomyces sp. NPDC015139]|uniref:hypothetical protein n=1 Tax=Streptomyces sp. NPDC015139 TaxID=3364942 RepID=UPI0036F564F5
MAIINTRRLAPLLIVTTLATGGISLTTTSAFAATTATATGVTTDTDGPGSSILNAYSKHRDHQKIGEPPASSGGVVAPGMDGEPNSDEVSMGPLVVAESRTGHARPGPIITDKTVNGGNGNSDEARGGDTQTGGNGNSDEARGGDTQTGGNGNSDEARGGDTQTGGNGNSDEARGGDTQPPTGQAGDSNAANSNLGPGQDIDYAIWTNPNPGPVVN